MENHVMETKTSDAKISMVSQTIDTPYYNVHTAPISSNGVDVFLTLSRLVPTLGQVEVVAQPVCILSLSRGTAKEITLALGSLLTQLDTEFGAIDTPYLKERREKER